MLLWTSHAFGANGVWSWWAVLRKQKQQTLASLKLVWFGLVSFSKQNNPQNQCVGKTHIAFNRALESEYLQLCLKGISVMSIIENICLDFKNAIISLGGQNYLGIFLLNRNFCPKQWLSVVYDKNSDSGRLWKMTWLGWRHPVSGLHNSC